ncbi:flagellar motor protein MotB [Sphingobium sp. B2]|uniref:flagellar motor protein MotB n=1 Tax=Sphingobium sp. B2 TaxID=2583228 RepID=UPI0011A4D6FF|nr:flagellar motor protein MotB [Sphingobium sp. B2]
MSQSNDKRPIVIRKVKKIAGGHHGGAWKVAYADFVTAMMAFFMLLWLISSPDKEKLKGLAEYFSPSPPNAPQAMGQTSGASQTPGAGGHTQAMNGDGRSGQGVRAIQSASAGVARGGSADIPDSSLRVLAQELKLVFDSAADPSDAAQNVQVEQSRDGLRINIMDNDKHNMFVGGGATLNAYGRGLLTQVAGKIMTSRAQIAIEGHTDSVGGSGDANWRLSGERALAARSALIGAGLPKDRMGEVVAMADTRPVYPDQPERPENRRITIVLLADASAMPGDVSFNY